MARRRRKATVDEVPNQAPPAPPFLSIPDLAHSNIASFLPDGNKPKKSRLRVLEVSRALLGYYGGTLTEMSTSCSEGRSAARLAALLQKQKKLVDVTVYEQKAIPALCHAIVQGCWRGVERIELHGGDAMMTQRRLNLLAEALEVEGALARLATSIIDCVLAPGE